MEVVDVYTEANPEPNDRTGRRECRCATSEGGRQDIKEFKERRQPVDQGEGKHGCGKRGPALGGQLKDILVVVEKK